MEMLKEKLYQIAKQQHMDKIDDIKGVQNEIAWGHQIRSYVFMPYTMVKDHRTNYETGNVDAVMDGDLDGFILKNPSGVRQGAPFHQKIRRHAAYPCRRDSPAPAPRR